MFKKRQICEEKIYKTLDLLDPSGENSAYYKKKFAKMTDKQFLEFFKSNNFTVKFQTKIFTIEPKMKNIKAALDYLKVPAFEKVYMPYLYEDPENGPVASKEALVVYLPVKKVKQFLAKKNSMSTDIAKRDMKTGLLLDVDKNGNSSDREFESLAVLGAKATIREMSTYRADSMNAKNEFYNQINNTGMVSQKDVDVSNEDLLARNELNVYLLGSGLNSNLINEGDYLIKTLKDKKRRTERETE